MKIVIIGLKNHPATIKLLNKLTIFPQHTFYLLQPIKIPYSPKEIAYLIRKNSQQDTIGIKINRFYANLLFHNPGFILKLAYYLHFNKFNDNPQQTENSEEYETTDKLSISYPLYEKYVQNVNSKKTESWLKNIGPDLIICSSNGSIIRKNIIVIPRIGIINTHPGILPKYRGMNPIEYTILNGDPIGATTYFIDEGIDTGKILFTTLLESGKFSYNDVKKRILDILVDSNVRAIELIETGKFESSTQKLNAGKQYFPIDRELIAICRCKLATKKN